MKKIKKNFACYTVYVHYYIAIIFSIILYEFYKSESSRCSWPECIQMSCLYEIPKEWLIK